MLDFNHRPTFTETLNTLIDAALVAEQKTKPERDYMGASRLGVSCQRAQYEKGLYAVSCGTRQPYLTAAAALNG